MNGMLKNLLQIRTPEGVVFHLHLASPMLRFAAWVIDLMVILVALNAVSFFVQITAIISDDLASAFNILVYSLLTLGYAIVCEWFLRGQTLGKRIFRIQVVDEMGLQLRFSQVLLRNLLRVVDSLPLLYLVGGVSMMMSRRFQRLGDLTAGTVVIKLQRFREPDIQQLMRGKYNTLRSYPHLIARLRQNISPEDVGVALEALLRRKDLENKARIQIFSNLASHIRKAVNLPDAVFEGLSDEQFVSNVVEVLYTKENRAEVLPGVNPEATVAPRGEVLHQELVPAVRDKPGSVDLEEGETVDSSDPRTGVIMPEPPSRRGLSD